MVDQWVDLNLQYSVGSLACIKEWRVIFRETVNTIWFWKNKRIYDGDKDIPGTAQIVVTIIGRVRE